MDRSEWNLDYVYNPTFFWNYYNVFSPAGNQRRLLSESLGSRKIPNYFYNDFAEYMDHL